MTVISWNSVDTPFKVFSVRLGAREEYCQGVDRLGNQAKGNNKPHYVNCKKFSQIFINILNVQSNIPKYADCSLFSQKFSQIFLNILNVQLNIRKYTDC